MTTRRNSSLAESEKTVLAMPGTRLKVHIGKDGAVDNETVNVSKSAKDEIVWSSDGEAFTVDFPVSPFGVPSFEVKRGQDKSSGPVRQDAGVGYYPYYITIGGGKTVDPGVNVKP